MLIRNHAQGPHIWVLQCSAEASPGTAVKVRSEQVTLGKSEPRCAHRPAMYNRHTESI